MESHKHNLIMKRRKAFMAQRIARAQAEKGVLLVLTGDGKGKSSSAFGMAVRALGHGMRVAIVQFIKAPMDTGEERFFRQFEPVAFHAMGEGFTWDTQNFERDQATAQAGWQTAKRYLQDADWDMVILDELCVALAYHYLDWPSLRQDVLNRPAHQHVIITGRGAPQALIEDADTVTEMRLVKHAFDAGIKAQKGVEL
ncbi:MAG TPA: cob(I)yrinic acid a,c-diamide adenosyltransferase [Piscirickettsiaceae bacterium]|nr:cob(I)yrinic acid a,c-diamide adenosyltransferase [Piscirickettsiaceae bacterium]HIQ40284.1 cob(I)yrinic acid a,c-diamide adenosyltransferase [Sulfurivirga caldicuralii]